MKGYQLCFWMAADFLYSVATWNGAVRLEGEPSAEEAEFYPSQTPKAFLYGRHLRSQEPPQPQEPQPKEE
jgi:hypothetical protein